MPLLKRDAYISPTVNSASTHGSRANPSGRRRAALVGRFMPGHCHYDHELGLRLAEPHKAHDYGKRALFLLRGRDRSGRNDFSVGH